jgi:tetratricopeptide (TPR) repeat protein
LAALSLAQIYVDTQQPQKAVELIEEENIGPKTLVEKEDAAAKDLAYQIETYKVALRAYIGALPTAPADQGQVLMNKAEGVMNALKKLMGGDPAGQRRLIGIYISLATDIQKQIDNAPANQRAALISGFEVFLSRVGEATKDVKELFWVAQTFYTLGESSDTNPTTLMPEAKRFYTKAVDAYNKILALQGKDDEVTPQMVMQIQMRLATTKRRLQQYKEAVNLFEEILLAKNMMLNVQVEAAKTYQEWGRIGDPVVYDRAVMGGRTNEKTGKYTIWGWSRIAKQTMPDEESEKYIDVFYEARLNQAKCRFSQGKRAAAAKEREEFFGLAKKDIEMTYRLYPDMGGGAWTSKFDGLLKQVQQSLKQKPTGLAGLSEYEEGPKLLKSEKKKPDGAEEVETEEVADTGATD